MSHAEKCPVCGGVGNVPDVEGLTHKTCHGCKGEGWVTVDSNDEEVKVTFVTNLSRSDNV